MSSNEDGLGPVNKRTSEISFDNLNSTAHKGDFNEELADLDYKQQ